MAEKRPAANPPGKSSNTKSTWSNLPPEGIQSGPRVGFSYATPTGPQIAATIGVTGPSPGRSAVSQPLPLDPATGKPAAVARPRNGLQGDDTLSVNGMNATGGGLSPAGVSPSDEIAARS